MGAGTFASALRIVLKLTSTFLQRGRHRRWRGRHRYRLQGRFRPSCSISRQDPSNTYLAMLWALGSDWRTSVSLNQASQPLNRTFYPSHVTTPILVSPLTRSSTAATARPIAIIIDHFMRPSHSQAFKLGRPSRKFQLTCIIADFSTKNVGWIVFIL